jgi:hypothetical protein
VFFRAAGFQVKKIAILLLSTCYSAPLRPATVYQAKVVFYGIKAKTPTSLLLPGAM